MHNYLPILLVPLLRFNKFSSAYQVYQLKDLTTTVERPINMNDNEFYKLVTVKRRNEGIIVRGIFLGKSIKVKNQFRIKAGDFLISKRQIIHGACEIVPIELEDSIVSNEYHILHGKENILLTEYLNLMSKRPLLKKYFTLACVGVDIEKMLFKINDWKARDVAIPSIQEQKKIVSFFSCLDQNIEKHQEKIKQLEMFKTGITQKIFSQEIHFKDENGECYPAWKHYKIESFFSERSDRGFPELELLSVTIKDGVSSRAAIDTKDNSSEDKSNYKLVQPGDIVYNSMRMWQGASGVSKSKGIVSPAYTVLRPKIKICSEYFGLLFKTTRIIYQFKKYSQGLTSDTWNLKYPQIKDISIQVPVFEEQKRIADFFLLLNRRIAIEREKLEQVKLHKQSLMQQMVF
ncbi:restriction endonuclease subunit S [Paenibacillus taichungensis]